MNIDFKGENKVHRAVSLSIYLSICLSSILSIPGKAASITLPNRRGAWIG